MGRRIITSAFNFPGVQSVLRHGHAEGIWTRIELQKLNTIEQDDNALIILGGFTPDYAQIIRKLKKKGFRTGIFWTSSLGQMEQVPEEIDLFGQVGSLLQSKDLDFALCGDQTLPVIFGGRLIYAPYPLSMKESYLIKRPKEHKIGIFLPQHPRKNILNQVFSLLFLTHHPSIQLHHNLILPQLPFQTISYQPISDRDKFLTILVSLTLSLMVTHTESFGYSFVDAVLAGTIPIIGPAMAEYFPQPDFPLPITCPNPDSPKEIALTIAPWLECSDNHRTQTIKTLRKGLKELAEKNNAQLRNILGGL